jgi:cyclophilin family peptidyl-prolyl cis-trans isomerase
VWVVIRVQDWAPHLHKKTAVKSGRKQKERPLASEQLNTNPDYTVFGRVIEGMAVVLNITDTPVGNNGWGEMSKPMEAVYIEKISIEEI